MKKIIVFLLFFIFAVVLASLALQNHPVLIVISGIVSSGIFTLFFEDVLNNFKGWLSIPIRTSQLTIFLYGRGGSGKTTFIKSIMSLENLERQASTENIEYYKGIFPYAPNPGKRFKKKYIVPVVIADYKGQAPTQALDLKKNFMSQINVIIFIADVVHSSPITGKTVLGEQELINWLSSDTTKKLNDRFMQHHSYLGDAILSVIFSRILTVNNRKLRDGSVRFVINKIDVIERLIANGSLSLTLDRNLTTEDYIHNKFNIIEKYIFDACKQNRIVDVKCQAVSFAKGTGVRDLVTGLIKTHFSNLKIH